MGICPFSRVFSQAWEYIRFSLCWFVKTEVDEECAWRAPNPLPSLCPHQVSTSVQLKMNPSDSWEPWILCQTFSDLKPLGRPCSDQENFSSLCTQLHEPDLQERNILALHIMAIYAYIYVHNMVFQTNLHTSLHKYPVQLLRGTAAHIHKVSDTSQTHLTGQKPRNHSGSWGPLTVRQLSLQSKGNISCG